MPAASDSPAHGVLISQSGECKVVTSLMTDVLSGHFLHICHKKKTSSCKAASLQGGLIESTIINRRSVLTEPPLLVASLNTKTLIMFQKENKSINSGKRLHKEAYLLFFLLSRSRKDMQLKIMGRVHVKGQLIIGLFADPVVNRFVIIVWSVSNIQYN